MDDDQVEEVNGKAQNVRFGHDPGEKNKENQKQEGPEKDGFASEELDVFIIRPFDIHSSHPV
jgi:hypothetical protein